MNWEEVVRGIPDPDMVRVFQCANCRGMFVGQGHKITGEWVETGIPGVEEYKPYPEGYVGLGLLCGDCVPSPQPEAPAPAELPA